MTWRSAVGLVVIVAYNVWAVRVDAAGQWRAFVADLDKKRTVA